MKQQLSLKSRLSLVQKKVYQSQKIKGVPDSKLIKIEVPINSLIIAPNTMSKKDFDGFVLKWVVLMEKKLKKEDSAKLKKASKGELVLPPQKIDGKLVKGLTKSKLRFLKSK